MWNKKKAMDLIYQTGLIPIIRVDSTETAFRVAEAFITGGVSIIEVTFSVPGATDVVRKLSQELGDKVLVGTGTVLNAEMVNEAVEAGSEFIVSPGYSEELIKAAQKHSKPCIPGAMTPSEILDAHNLGADAVKVFPCGNLGGAAYIKAVRAPLPHIPLVPTGGVNLDTAGPLLEVGSFALGVGSAITDKTAIKEGRFEVITDNVKRFIHVVKKYR
ncbi:MAG: bifunctional 4-hydroxy-2-oxoglutarate aldolase/2-dehydro-3-deoxy-phosphogluconate aldolase [Candidatus Thorarchaeota archaeon]|nr:MAG: bifunctional 4-hydroxy-2-oxoglutarate aldolase/2-dehydro-3-deoxy-phosphogluconate aldolase [Candidatus Thorarchaeota archaeon]